MFHVEHSGAVAHWIRVGAAQLDIPLKEAQISQLVLYARELEKWNKKVNLTAARNDRELVVKHFLDSMFCGQALDLTRSVQLLDVGSGAGFPGLPLKILNQDLEVWLLEPNQKKTAFLRHIIGTLRLNGAMTISETIHDFSRKQGARMQFSYITSRALSVTKILPYFSGILAEKGKAILCRAKPMETSQDLDGFRISSEVHYSLPFGYGDRVLTVLERIAPEV